MWNFASGAAGAQILADGGFRFEFDWTPLNNTTDDWVCLNVGFNYLDPAMSSRITCHNDVVPGSGLFMA